MTLSDSSSKHDNTLYQFGDWQFSAGPGLLIKDGHPQHAEPKVIAVLLCLIKSRGNLVTREELLSQVWPRVVVNDEVLTRAISELRSLLGDSGRSRRYIQTVPKRGYLFVMPVASISQPSSANPSRAPSSIQALPTLFQTWSRFFMTANGVRVKTIALLLAVISVTTYHGWRQYDLDTVAVTQQPTPAFNSQSALRRELATMHTVLDADKIDDNQVRQIFLQPLTALTEDSETEAFAAGLTADLQHEIAQQPMFQVVHQLGSALSNPEFVLGGNVRIYQRQARIVLQLIDTQSASLIWSGSFEAELESPLRMQAKIARTVSQQLIQA
ncbi:winged helix-turn-helix domain-containing protein [Pseudohongiella acticola]|jgi:DNA-binding winged helix-turn-helix (wHTH) protein/TolB-like protein|uniref:winged helix-turn-helix domain-containing protein n=1 Tax=Pseudohongiella acticola TaxID=1524254 RepID=UPI0030EDCD89